VILKTTLGKAEKIRVENKKSVEKRNGYKRLGTLLADLTRSKKRNSGVSILSSYKAKIIITL